MSGHTVKLNTLGLKNMVVLLFVTNLIVNILFCFWFQPYPINRENFLIIWIDFQISYDLASYVENKQDSYSLNLDLWL